MKLPPDIAGRLDKATLAMASGNLPAVERLSLEILETNPNVSKAHTLLGIVAQRTGRSADAIRHLTRAYELDPNSFEATACLAAAHRVSGDLRNAIPFAELAVRLKPNDAMAQTDLGSMYLETLRLRKAEKHLRRGAALSGGGLHVQIALSQCLNREGKHEEALQVVRQALQSHPFSLGELLHFATLMMSLRNPGGAVEASREAIRCAPHEVRAYAQLAQALIEDGKGQEAFAVLNGPELANRLHPSVLDSETLTILGMAHQSVGQVEEARSRFRQAIDSPKPVGAAFYAFVHSCRVTEADRATISAMEERLESQDPSGDMTSLRFALGKAYEDLGDYAVAMAHYEAANRSHGPSPAAFERSKDENVVDQAVSMFSKEFIAENEGHGISTEIPIFVVGMIRSGTTLAEQILSSHPDVAGAGEVPFWTYNAPGVIDTKAGSIRHDRLRDTAERYVAMLKSGYPNKLRVVDKMPANFNYLGILHLGLPNARIIHMRRNPIDTCISIYSTHSRAHSEFGNDKANLVATFRQYEAIMTQWRELLPTERFLDVDYEDLVGNSEPTIRRMVEFCGLTWNDACLCPESNPRAVSTPSLWQVRRPINSSSVERWRRFEPWLAEFRLLL